MAGFDPFVLGRRVRHARRRAGMTLAALGERVGRPAPYLSQLENGRVEPKLGLVAALADALGTTTADLLADEAPSRRAALEIELRRLQADPRYGALGLTELRPGVRVPDEVLEHVVGLARAVVERRPAPDPVRARDQAHLANVALRGEMRSRHNYFPEIEQVATDALSAVGYPGSGPVSERVLTSLVAHFGFRVERVQGMPRRARSVADERSRTIYIPQRNDLRTREARSVLLHTVGHFALDHARTDNFGDYLRQRIESNYFAAAVLAPEGPAVELLGAAAAAGDISIEDLKEVFYVSYEMAAHRFTNLAVRHLDIPVHFLRTDPDGVILKAYEDDGMPFPTDADGRLEGERVSPLWGPRQAWSSSDSFSLHYQYTVTEVGEHWSVTYLETDNPMHAVTLGTTAAHAGSFRGSDTTRRVLARPSDEVADPALAARWEGVAWPSTSERSSVLAALPLSERPFTPFPGIDLVEVYRFLERHSPPPEGNGRRL